MTRLTNLIKEALSTKPKKKDCNCGCNTCKNVGNEGVLLNESVAPKQILSENLQYHVHNKLPLTENTFRYGSQSFINLWAEARALYLREIIHVNNDDKEILTETDLGNYGMYEGKKVPLDMPLDEESVNEASFKYDSGDYEEVETLFTKITGRPATDLDNNMFARSGGSADGDGEGWMLNIDDTNIPTNDKTKFVDAVMDLGKQRGWKIKQYGDDAVEIYEKESVNESFNIGDKVKFVGDKSSFKNLDPNKIYTINDIIRDTLFNDVRYVVGEEPLKVNDIQLVESEDLDKIRKEVEKIAQNSPGKGWTKKSIDQEVNRRFQQFLNRKSMNESEGVPHYTKDNKEWKGKVHKMPDGSLMSGNPHDEDGSGPNGKSEKLYHKGELDEVQDFEEEGDWEDDDNIYTGPYSYGIDKRTWDNDWRLPQDNLFNTSKTINATNNRMDSIRKMLKKYPKELAKFESDPEYPAFDMTYDELVKWYKSISNFDLSEAANKGLEQKLNSELGDINGIFAQEDIDVDDAEFYNVKPGNYIKYYIEDVNNSTILKVKRIAKANGLKFAKDLDDMLLFTSTSINEAAKKKKKKDPPIGKPKRGGSKAYYVYVRDPRTKKVKKISFGSGGLKAKINNKKARNAFAARHKCSTKTDKTKAGYWSCRLPRYAKLLGLKSSFSGFW